MNRIAMRANVLLIVAALLLGGVGFFVADYTMNAENWVMSGGSPHIYDENNEISTGLSCCSYYPEAGLADSCFLSYFETFQKLTENIQLIVQLLNRSCLSL